MVTIQDVLDSSPDKSRESHDHTSSYTPNEREGGGRLEGYEKRIKRAKKASLIGTGVLAGGTTYGVAGDDLKQLGLDPAEYAQEATDYVVSNVEPSQIHAAGDAAMHFLQHLG